MEYTTSTQSTQRMTLTTVHFTGTGREKRWASRMERYYAALTQAVTEYSRTLAPHEHYVCQIFVEAEDGEVVWVRVTLSHKRPGCVTARRQLWHRWWRGILWEEEGTPIL